MINNQRKRFWGMGLEHWIGAFVLSGAILYLLWKKESVAPPPPPPPPRRETPKEEILRHLDKPHVIIRPFEEKRIELNTLRPEVIEAVNEFIRLNPRPVAPGQ